MVFCLWSKQDPHRKQQRINQRQLRRTTQGFVQGAAFGLGELAIKEHSLGDGKPGQQPAAEAVSPLPGMGLAGQALVDPHTGTIIESGLRQECGDVFYKQQNE